MGWGRLQTTRLPLPYRALKFKIRCHFGSNSIDLGFVEVFTSHAEQAEGLQLRLLLCGCPL